MTRLFVTLAILLITLAISLNLSAAAALPEPQATAAPVDVEICLHVATADSIKIFYCEDIHLFVNQLGFMAFEP